MLPPAGTLGLRSDEVAARTVAGFRRHLGANRRARGLRLALAQRAEYGCSTPWHVLRSVRLREVGILLTTSPASMGDDFEISESQADLPLRSPWASGAHGAGMTGGGRIRRKSVEFGNTVYRELRRRQRAGGSA